MGMGGGGGGPGADPPHPAVGFVPVCSLGLEQEGRLNLGQEVGSLRFFSICGLQEGYEPFAINMKRPITLWFSKSLPQFVPVPPDHPQLEVREGGAWVGWGWSRGSYGGGGGMGESPGVRVPVDG